VGYVINDKTIDIYWYKMRCESIFMYALDFTDPLDITLRLVG